MESPTATNDYPAIRRFTIRICEGCLESRGEMCNTPACVFCWHSTEEINAALSALLIRPIIDGERLVADEGELEGAASVPALRALIDTWREQMREAADGIPEAEQKAAWVTAGQLTERVNTLRECMAQVEALLGERPDAR